MPSQALARSASVCLCEMPGWARPIRRIVSALNSAELKGRRKRLRIRPEIFDFEPELGLKLDQTKPKISGTVPTNRQTTIPNDSEPISACFDDDPKLLHCEIAQPSQVMGVLNSKR